jgi:hypothetical protein
LQFQTKDFGENSFIPKLFTIVVGALDTASPDGVEGVPAPQNQAMPRTFHGHGLAS